MKNWKPKYKDTVYRIINDTIKTEIVASGLSMSDALRLLDSGLLFQTLEDAKEHLRKSHEVPRFHGETLMDALTELKRIGLTYAEIVKVYGVPRDENPYAAFIQESLANDDDMELDDQVILSESETGCWVSCWCYVEDEAVGIKRHALTLVVDLDERGIFKAHVENHKGESIFEFSNEDDNGNPSDDGLWLITAGYMHHGRDTRGLLEYLREIGRATRENTLSLRG